jgi:hypothetical protein
MLKKDITFETVDGDTITRSFRFHISEPEFAELNWGSREGTLKELMDAAVNSEDVGAILRLFERVIKTAYGKRNDDGVTFDKTPELTRQFIQSDAYSVLFVELMADPDVAAKFMNDVMPKRMEQITEPVRPEPQDYKQKPPRIVESVPELKMPEPGTLQLPDPGAGSPFSTGPYAGLTGQQIERMTKDELQVYMEQPSLFRR